MLNLFWSRQELTWVFAVAINDTIPLTFRIRVRDKYCLVKYCLVMDKLPVAFEIGMLNSKQKSGYIRINTLV